MSRSRLRSFCVATLGIVALLSSLGLADASPTPAVRKAEAPRVVSRATVTLISGDLVTFQRLADGRQVATAAPREGRRDISFSTQQDGEHVYVIPSDAIPLLA